MLGKVKDMYRLQKQAKQVKKQLKSIHIEAEYKGVTAVVDAEQKIVSIQIADKVPREKIAEYIKEALNRALAKAQVVASEKMQGVMGELGLGTGAG
jgi:DNA-binding protein YbaB